MAGSDDRGGAPYRPSLTVPVVVPDGLLDEPPGLLRRAIDATASHTLNAAHDVARQLRDRTTAEVQALLVDPHPDASRRLAALSLGNALLCADVLDHAGDAVRHLDLADRHPLAPGLRIALALAYGDRRALEGAHALLERAPGGAVRTSLLVEVAGAWLHGFADAAAAAAAIGLALDAIDGPVPDDVFALATQVRATTGDHAGLTALEVGRATRPGASLAAVAAAASALLDRRGDPRAALALASSALASSALAPAGGAAEHPVHGLRVLGLALEAALALGDARGVALAQQRADRTGGAEAEAWRALAQALATHAASPEGVGDALATLSLSLDTAPAQAVAALGRAVLAGDLAAQQAAHDALAAAADEQGVAGLAHRWRAAELVERLGVDEEALLRRVRWLHQHAPSAQSTRMLERALWATDVDALARAVERAGPDALDRAVTIAGGRLGDVPRALRLLRRKLAQREPSRPRDLEVLAALLRRGRALAELAEVYERLAGLAGSPATEAAWWLAAGLVHLGRARVVEATRAFEAARRAAPSDAMPALALVASLRLGEQWPAAAAVLEATVPWLADEELRLQLLFELADLYGTRLGDPARARLLLEAVRAQRPDDERVVIALARVLATAEPAAAIALLAARVEAHGAAASLGAVEALVPLYQRAGDPASLAALAALLEQALAHRVALGVERRARWGRLLAELCRDHLGRPADAARALEIVLEHDPSDLLALDGLAALHGELGRPADRARLLARAIELDDAPRATARRLVELAGLRGAAGAVDEALALARRAAELEPDDGAGFGAFEQLAYRHERWSQLVQFYAEVIERTAGGRRAALGDLHLRWAQVLRRQLGDPDGALAQVQLAITTDGDLEQITYALEQLAPAPHELHATLAALRRRATSAQGEARDQAVFAAVRVAAMGEANPGELELLVGLLPPSAPWPTDVYDALERVHERRADWHRLLAVLRRRLAVTPSGPIHVALARRIATLSEQHLRDSRLAVEHYQRVLQGQPDNRDALEALARIHEATEAWPEFLDVNRRLIGLTTDRTARGLLLFRCGSVSEAKFGALDDAVRYYEAAIKTSSTCMPAVHGLRDLYRRRQRWADVARTLEVEVDLWEDEKEQAGVYAQLADVCAQHLADPERAAAMYARALEVDPGCLPANRALFERAFADARWADAVRHAAVLASKAGRDGDAAARAEFAARRAVALRHTGDLRAALASARSAVDASPTNVRGLDELLAVAPQVLSAAELTDLWRDLERALRRRDDTRGQLARLEVARARAALAAGDLDAVALHARLASTRAPGDADVVFALVELDVTQRHWGEATTRLRQLLDGPLDEPRRIAALWRLADLHAAGEVRPESALAVLTELATVCPDEPEVPYRAAQEAVALGRLDDARRHVEHALALATRPERAEQADGVARLAALTYYAGRIADGRGDVRAATQSYRRAIEYAPGFAPAALALARRAVDASDLDGAQAGLVTAAHAAIAHDGPAAAVALQRGLARVLLAAGDRASAIDAYRGILRVSPDEASDRVALAELYAIDDPPRAIVELRRGLDRSLRHAPTYRLLASLYERSALPARAARVLEVMTQLGLCAPSDEIAFAALRDELAPPPPLREAGAVRRASEARAVSGPWPALWDALHPTIHEALARGGGLVTAPLSTVRDRAARGVIASCQAELGADVEVLVADRVPGLWTTRALPTPTLVLDRSLMIEPALGLRFVVGMGVEAARRGVGGLLEPRSRARAQLVAMVGELARADEDGVPAAPVSGELATASLGQLARQAEPAGLAAWLTSVEASCRRNGLLACGSLLAACQQLARLAGEPPALDEGQVTIGLALPGADLVQYFLSDEYHLATRPPA